LRTLTTGSTVPPMKNSIRQERERQGFSQQRLAEMAGLTTKTIADIESGKTQPRLGTAHGIASALGKTLGDLFDLTAA
jgi:DNA-binding XRE family transcriptional regulator